MATKVASPTSRRRRLLRPEEAETYLGVNSRELRSLREKGLIQPVRLGHRTLRYDQLDLDALIEERKGGVAWVL